MDRMTSDTRVERGVTFGSLVIVVDWFDMVCEFK